MGEINTATAQPNEYKRRLGLIAARVGATFAHRLTIEMPLEEPEYQTNVRSAGLARSRTTLNTSSPQYAYGERHGAPFPVKALPGATMMITVQDLTRCSNALLPHVKWMCRHPMCEAKRYATKADLFQDHPENKKLADEADRLGHVYGHAHVYVAVIELPGVPEKKDEKSGKVTPEQIPTTVLLSDEE